MDGDFWDLTPKEYDALVDQWKERENREYLRTGILTSTIRNIFRPKHARLISPSDIFPFLKKQSQEIPVQLAIANAAAFVRAVGGKDLRPHG